MEMENDARENTLFSNINATRTDLPVGYPADATTNPNSKVILLNGKVGGNKVGPSLVLRVMAGDKIAISSKAFYKSGAPTDNADGNLITNMIAALVQSFNMGSGSMMHYPSGGNPSGAISGDYFQNTYDQLKKKDASQNVSGKPKAFLNYVLFDDQFKLVDQNSGVRQVNGVADRLQSLGVNEMVMNKTGFLYVYTSNESAQDVYFDNLMVTHTAGPVLEETHYYPFGLTMTGISSKAFGVAENKQQKFQGQSFNDDLQLDFYEFKWRQHDPQIGRFIEVDPLAEKYGYNSPYAFSENHVTTHIELEGLEKFPIHSAPPSSTVARGWKNQKMLEVQRDADRNKPGPKLTVASGGITGIKLDVTFNVENVSADDLQIIQTFEGSRRDDGFQVGTMVINENGTYYDAFVDGGINSPFVLMGNSPASATMPYYLTSSEAANQVHFDKTVGTGTIRTTDKPGAISYHKISKFETSVVAINYLGTGKDKVLGTFSWGWSGNGTAPFHKGNGVNLTSTFSSGTNQIIKHDYPTYQLWQP
jgi:RHS repeat-associated protein